MKRSERIRRKNAEPSKPKKPCGCHRRRRRAKELDIKTKELDIKTKELDIKTR